MTFRWQANNCQLLVVFGALLPPNKKKQQKRKKPYGWNPADKSFSIHACESNIVFRMYIPSNLFSAGHVMLTEELLFHTGASFYELEVTPSDHRASNTPRKLNVYIISKYGRVWDRT